MRPNDKDETAPMTTPPKLFRALYLRALSLCLAVSPWVAPPAQAAPTWQPLGPSGGSIDEIQASPSAPDTLFALAQGDLFRSNDGGVRWSAVGGEGLNSLAISPANPERLLAVRRVQACRSSCGS